MFALNVFLKISTHPKKHKIVEMEQNPKNLK